MSKLLLVSINIEADFYDCLFYTVNSWNKISEKHFYLLNYRFALSSLQTCRLWLGNYKLG